VTLRLEYRESWVATLQLLFLLSKVSLTKLFESHRWSWTSGVHSSISAGSGNFVFWPSQQRYGSYRLCSALCTLKWSMRWSDTHPQIKTGLSVLTGLSDEASGSHSMGRDPKKDCDFADDQKIGRAEAIKT